MTGSGAVSATLKADAEPEKANSYPASPFKINFSSDSVYTITDTATSTVVATRLYVPGADINYQGISVQFDGAPKAGDSFSLRIIPMDWVAMKIFYDLSILVRRKCWLDRLSQRLTAI